jgi:hypothetical protein
MKPAKRIPFPSHVILTAAAGLTVAAVGGMPARGQTADPPDVVALQRLIAQQAQQIEAMQRRLDQIEMVQKAARGPVRAGQTGTGVAAGGATGGTAGHIVQGPGTQPQTVNQQPGAGQLAAQPAPVGGHGSVGPASPATEPQSVNQGPVSPGTPQAIAQAPAAPARGTPALPVLSGNDKVKVTLSGQIDRDLIFHGDGSGKLDTYFADNNVSSTRIRALGAGAIDDRNTVVSALEFDLRSNTSASITRQSANNNGGDTPVIGPFRVRRAEVGLQSQQYGTVLFGRGSSFSDGIAEIDLSGTDVAIYSYAPDSWGGLQFADALKPFRRAGDPSVSQVFDDFDGPRDDRLRYDTPSFNGLTLGGTVGQGYFWDVGARYSAQINGVKLASGLSYQNFYSTRPSRDLQDGIVPAYVPFSHRMAGSIAVLLPSGFNLALSGGWGQHIPNCCTSFVAGDIATHDATTWFAKVGYQAHIFEVATTNFAVDAGQTFNRIRDGDVATRVGFEINQPIPRAGLELFMAYERLSLRRSGADFQPGNFALMGSRVQF